MTPTPTLQSTPVSSFLDEITVRHLPLKRIFDVLFSLLALLATFPLFLVLAIIIRISSKGPAVYGHTRVGRGGKPFKCLKFRSMYQDADTRLHQLLSQNPTYAAEWQESRKLKNDPRITAIGQFLRKTSLDELPQFLNVLKGDLSVVGPRPVVEDEVKQYYKEKAQKILSVRPGVTGLWQISGRSNTSYKTRVELDEHYVENRSFGLDLTLVLKTVPALLTRKGAY